MVEAGQIASDDVQMPIRALVSGHVPLLFLFFFRIMWLR